MKDMLRVDIVVDEVQFREATGQVRFDDDPYQSFFDLVDSNQGSLSDAVNRAVLEVLRRANAKVEWTVSTTPYQTPMTQRGRHERGAAGLPQIGGRRPAKR